MSSVPVLEVLASFAVAGEVLSARCASWHLYSECHSLCFRTYILSMTPFASVQEWNLYCIFMVHALFSATGAEAGFAGYSLLVPRRRRRPPPLLSVFLLLVLLHPCALRPALPEGRALPPGHAPVREQRA